MDTFYRAGVLTRKGHIGGKGTNDPFCPLTLVWNTADKDRAVGKHSNRQHSPLKQPQCFPKQKVLKPTSHQPNSDFFLLHSLCLIPKLLLFSSLGCTSKCLRRRTIEGYISWRKTKDWFRGIEVSCCYVFSPGTTKWSLCIPSHDQSKNNSKQIHKIHRWRNTMLGETDIYTVYILKRASLSTFSWFHSVWPFGEDCHPNLQLTQNHTIMKLEEAYKIVVSTLLLNAGIFSWMLLALECSLPPLPYLFKYVLAILA